MLLYFYRLLPSPKYCLNLESQDSLTTTKLIRYSWALYITIIKKRRHFFALLNFFHHLNQIGSRGKSSRNHYQYCTCWVWERLEKICPYWLSRSRWLRKEYDIWCFPNGWCCTFGSSRRWNDASNERTFITSKTSESHS